MPRNLLVGVLGSEIFCSQKRKMAETISPWRSHLYSSLIFNERIYEYGDKIKVIISWKSVDFNPQF